MAPPTVAEFLRLTKTQRNGYNKTELMEIIEAAVPNDSGNDLQVQTLIASLTALTAEIKGLKTIFTDHQELTRKQFDEFRQQLGKQNEIIAKQQLYLEKQDRKERECNLIVLGVPEEGETLEGATSDSDKVSKVWDAASITSNVKSLRRIGQPGERRRPILVEVVSRADRDSALDKARDLKGHSNDIYKRIFVKKDQHPSVRAEWKRLHEVFKTEKERPDNQPCNIHFNFRERKIYKDGEVIDSWNMQGF